MKNAYLKLAAIIFFITLSTVSAFAGEGGGVSGGERGGGCNNCVVLLPN